MSPAHRRYLLLELCVGGTIINFLINGAIAWATFRSMATVPLWGPQSIAGDTIGTAFFLSFFTCLIVTPLGHRQVRSGRLPRLGWRRATHPALGRLPERTLRRALALGVLCVLAVVPPSLAVLSALDVSPMRFSSFWVFKSTFAAGLGAIMTPLIGLCMLGDADPPEPAADAAG